MTLNQLHSLTEQELDMLFYIVNVFFPPTSPQICMLVPRQLTWFKKDALIKKIVDAFPKVLPEGHLIYSSLLEKLGVKIEIKYQPPPPPVAPVVETPVTSSVETPVSASVEMPLTSSTEPTGSI